MSRRGWLLFAAMGVIWGVPYLLIKVAVADLSPASLVFLRTATGVLVLLPIAAARGSIAPLRAHWRWILVYTVVEVAVPWMLLSDAERHISSSLAGLLIAAVPFIGALLALVTGGEDRLDAAASPACWSGSSAWPRWSDSTSPGAASAPSGRSPWSRSGTHWGR